MRTIAHISDLHFNRTDPQAMEALVRDLHQQKPDVLVNSGDLTQRGRAAQFRQAARFMQRLPGPQIIIPGNHDIPLFDLVRRFIFPLRRFTEHISGDLAPAYHDEQLAVLGANSARSWTWRLNGFWKDGRLSDEQLRHIQLYFARFPEPFFKVLVTHHPFIPPPGERLHGIIGRSAMALDMLEQVGVDMLLAGHLHLGYSGDVRTHHEAVKRSILSIQAGTAISTRKREEANAYNFITIEGEQVTISVRAFTGGSFEQLTLTRYTREKGIWRQE
jgi:3',5'-cyclic AMP phosphodiesterase CpdA